MTRLELLNEITKQEKDIELLKSKLNNSILIERYLNIDYSNILNIKIMVSNTPTKEEVFQIIEKLLTIKTID